MRETVCVAVDPALRSGGQFLQLLDGQDLSGVASGANRQDYTEGARAR